MLRISLLTLLFDRGKMLAALAGVTLAATLALAQLAIYRGFLQTSSAVVSHAGGDLWVMARGARVFDNAQALSAGSRFLVASQPCVRNVRGLVVAWVTAGLGGGDEAGIQLIGIDSPAGVSASGRKPLPWSVSQGSAGELRPGSMRVSVDELDFGKLKLAQNPRGTRLSLASMSAFIGVISKGIHSFALSPQMFTDVASARRILGLGEGQAHYWIADLHSAECMDRVSAAIEAQSDLQVHTTARFEKLTQDFWVGGSGAGAVLLFGAVLGLVVGAVIVAQTLYSITRDRLPELATLKALGAKRSEIMTFVAWQSAALALVGGGLALVLAFTLAWLGDGAGLTLVLSPDVLALGMGAMVVMCVVASLSSIRSVLALDPAEVFR